MPLQEVSRAHTCVHVHLPQVGGVYQHSALLCWHCYTLYFTLVPRSYISVHLPSHLFHRTTMVFTTPFNEILKQSISWSKISTSVIILLSLPCFHSEIPFDFCCEKLIFRSGYIFSEPLSLVMCYSRKLLMTLSYIISTLWYSLIHNIFKNFIRIIKIFERELYNAARFSQISHQLW